MPIARSGFRWLDPWGGPVGLLRADRAARWSGSGGCDHSELSLACGRQWYVLFGPQDARGLAFCEPNRTGVRAAVGGGVLIAQWLAAPSEEAVEEATEDSAAIAWTRRPGVFVAGGDLVLFDTALSGVDAISGTDPSLRVATLDIPLGVSDAKVDVAGCRLFLVLLEPLHRSK